ncbi:SEL1-like repeat protein [Janthinobacterium aquaticum]|uniref:hypothetical protein n=1 Tax=Janthinobacterium sp. FT58W TaxID=2654254 RepID=UPI0012646C91|nr:hypothetical protein [Janthinobacterium sp. FT58W]KAB8042289.1 hypothetical protein GCM43_14580 [Janthinobacterium sp. FT58W]
MNKQTTSVSYNDATYHLRIGGWLQHLHSDLSEALMEIATEDIRLPNGQKAGDYKAKKKEEYDAQPDSSYSSAKKYLNVCSQRDFRLDWDMLIGVIKQEINGTCVPLLLAKHKLSGPERYEILRAASNGHVGAMFWIGARLRAKKDDNCLLWLSMAHNQGHVGACYEMAVHLKSKGNHNEALRCLIVSADGGFDIAYMSIFNIDNLITMFKIKKVNLLENMLDEFAATHSSSARYLKGMLMLFQGKKTEALAVLEDFLKSPKRQPPKSSIDKVYEKQIKVVGSFVGGILADIASGMQPLGAIHARCEQVGFIKFEDYDELVIAVESIRLSA